MLWVCELVRPLFYSVYLMVNFCLHQYIRGRTGPSAQWHWRKKCDKSQPDLQLPQEQDVQKDQGEFLFILLSCSVVNFKQKCLCNKGWGHRLFSFHFSWTPFLGHFLWATFQPPSTLQWQFPNVSIINSTEALFRDDYLSRIHLSQ